MYTLDAKVRFSECTEHGLLGINGLMNYFQDTALFLNEEAGRGIEHMRANHFTFFVLTWHVEVARLPRYLDEIRIRSWTPEMSRVSATRCFTIETREGTPCVSSQGQFCAVDLNTGRPIRFPETERVYLEPDTTPLVERQPRKVFVPEGGAVSPARVVEPHMLDANHHMNNVFYLSHASDLIMAHDPSFVPRTLTIQYVRPAALGDKISCRLVPADGGWAAELADPAGDAYARLTCQGRRQDV